MPTQKKIWVHNGLVQQYPTNFLNTVHGSQGCTTCHGGNDAASTRVAAHDATWEPIPGANKCAGCHADIVSTSAKSLHTNLGGYVKALKDRGFDITDATSLARFNQQCTKCHVANSGGQAACGFCHVAVPKTAGGGFLNGHNFRRTPDMERNCTACHGSRIKDEFFGLNNALIARNNLGEASVRPDVHLAQAQSINSVTGLPKGCVLCHSGTEMHGGGAPEPAGSGARYDVASKASCTNCHTAQGSNSLHTAGHLATMDCQVCHSQSYKNCFGCHTDTDVAATGLPFYRINEADPTLTARPAGSAPDALMTFRIGKNPLWQGAGDAAHRKFAVLRHAPGDRDVFRYPLAAPVEGLIPNMTAKPTWRYATPHNIQKVSLATPTFPAFDVGTCGNCHGAAYSQHWLTDPVSNSHGWISTTYQDDERSANSSVLQTVPLPMQAAP